ncbi:MAG: hypothetical protein O7A98_08745 [Acidobacteria bacterium]|nr:hypothetical protein [Acidobacteriota bacterium]
MVRPTALILSLILFPLSAAGGRRQPQQLLQSPVAERGWVVSVDDRRARLSAPDGGRGTFRVRRGERWLGFSEFAGGWIAAGILSRAETLDLSLVADLGRGPRRLRPPLDRQGALRTAPTPIVSSAGLAGLAWLEGDEMRRFSVRAAAFEHGSFTEAVTVSAPLAGSQTGLSATVLEDGSWLLVWSRFDGHDDEIYWALRPASGQWTTPRRLAADNAVPDVTPHVLTHGSGALIAWSQLRHEYEVVTARFEGGSWSMPYSLGVAGTISPAFRRLGEDDYLLVRNAWPAGWTAFHLDAAGRPSDFAVVARSSVGPPVLRRAGRSTLAFEWPDRREHDVLDWEPVR